MKTIYLFRQGFKIHLFPVYLLSVILNLFQHRVNSIMLQLHKTLKQVQGDNLRQAIKIEAYSIYIQKFSHYLSAILFSVIPTRSVTSATRLRRESFFKE